MNRLPTVDDLARMPWPAQDTLARRLGLRHRTQLPQRLRPTPTPPPRQADLEPDLLYTCSGCGFTRHVGLTCRTCALLATWSPTC